MTFLFCDDDLKLESREGKSKFDDLLLSSWDAAMAANLFSYDMSDLRFRVVPGPTGFIVVFHPKRFSNRRPPAPSVALDQPLDRARFNFTKVGEQEVICRLARAGEKDEKGEQVLHPLFINVAPIDYGHVLVVPFCSALWNQVMRRDGILISVRMLLLSACKNFYIGFNSLLAFASVNHLHVHGWYSKYELQSCRAALCPLAERFSLFTFRDHPVRGFVFLLTDLKDLEPLADSVLALFRLLHDANIPHNAFFCRAERGVRLCVWPRRAEWDNAKHTKSFNIAVAELGGLLICNNEADFESFSEESIATELASVGLKEEEFSALSKRFVEHLESN